MKTADIVDFKLYLITDRALFPDHDSFFAGIEDALKGGAKAVQLREKDLPAKELLDMARRLRDMTRKYGAKLFVNERVDIAISSGADGVHLGAAGIPVNAARKMTDGRLIVGVSTHGIGEVRRAEDDGADFVTLGPVFETPSKVSYGKPLGIGVLEEARGISSIPLFAIGGIRPERVKEVLQSGANGVAVISAILASAGIQSTTEEFMRLLQ